MEKEEFRKLAKEVYDNEDKDIEEIIEMIEDFRKRGINSFKYEDFLYCEDNEGVQIPLDIVDKYRKK